MQKPEQPGPPEKRDRKEYARAYYHANKKAKPLHARASRYRTQYGLTIEQVVAMFDACNDKCECCGSPVARPASGADKKDVGNIDHCHNTGKVRGILCNKCNQAIGLLNDKPELAVSYLERTNERT
jgi:hypothetical protein